LSISSSVPPTSTDFITFNIAGFFNANPTARHEPVSNFVNASKYSLDKYGHVFLINSKSFGLIIFNKINVFN
jgi:hypothetical protein